MRNHQRLLRLIGQMAAAIGLALAFLPAFAADFPAGTYSVDGAKPTLTFDDKSQFRVEEGGKTMVTGKYTSKGDQVEFTDQKGPWACTKNGQKTGTYQWKYDGSVLTLTKVTDACTDRVGSLSGVKWKATH
jgi:hypothetical protein